MDNHYLDAPNEIDDHDIRKLPDRTDLSELYPDADRPELARQRRLDTRMREAVNGQAVRSLTSRALIVGGLMPLPALLGLLALSYLSQKADASQSFMYLLVAIAGLIVWVILVARLYSIVARKLDQVGVNPMAFLGFHLGCLALISKPLYDYMQVGGADLTSRLTYSLTVLGVSVVLAWSFLQLTVNQSLSSSTRLVLVACIVMASLALPVVDLVVQMGWQPAL